MRQRAFFAAPNRTHRRPHRLRDRGRPHPRAGAAGSDPSPGNLHRECAAGARDDAVDAEDHLGREGAAVLDHVLGHLVWDADVCSLQPVRGLLQATYSNCHPNILQFAKPSSRFIQALQFTPVFGSNYEISIYVARSRYCRPEDGCDERPYYGTLGLSFLSTFTILTTANFPDVMM